MMKQHGKPGQVGEVQEGQGSQCAGEGQAAMHRMLVEHREEMVQTMAWAKPERDRSKDHA
jgi:hypothetical protein